jgi:MFS family permease
MHDPVDTGRKGRRLMTTIRTALLKPVMGVAPPLRQRTFRRIWSASLFSNLGQQMQAVAAGWTMLQLTHAADMVAAVQTASMLPIMLLAIPAGAIADMYDRRRVAICALSLALSGALLLAVLAATGLLTPWPLLISCFIVGSGIAIYSPAWQASASEVVGAEAMPAAVTLYSMSSNVARSVGPAIGGVIVASAGAMIAFGVNALLYLPLIGALYAWKRKHEPPRLPPERLDRAMISGLRYVRHAPPIRRVLARALVTAIGGSAIYALMPMVARDLLNGGAGTYGLLLGAFGVGAVTAALASEAVRERFSANAIVATCSLTIGAALVVAALSSATAVTAAAFLCAGGAWMVSVSIFNVGVQFSAPRWVAGRALATFQASVAGGLAGGSWLWGYVAADHGLQTGLLGPAALMLIAPALGFWLRMPDEKTMTAQAPAPERDPEVRLDITGRSGPILIEVEYRVEPARAREFYHLILHVKRSRERNGAYDVSVARDLTEPSIWIERFSYPTWHDFLRARDRPTLADRALRDRLLAFHSGDTPPHFRRLLERPFGSVRWRDNAPDPGAPDTVAPPLS